MRTFHIPVPDLGMKAAIEQKIDNLNKPKGALGELEKLAMQVCLIQHTLSPTLSHPCHLLLGGDHGIEREGVSVSPRDVTWQQMVNFTKGGGGVNMFCRQHGFHLRIVDTGVDHDLSAVDGIIHRKIAPGTANFLYGAAMTEDQYWQAIDVGATLVDECAAEGCNIVCVGEMGIANTSPSSIWMSLFGNIPLDECIGVGAGLNNEGLLHKHEVLRTALQRFEQRYPEAIQAPGMLSVRAAELGMAVMVDGFIMTACMLAASRLYPDVLHYAIFGHCGDESGHRRMLNLMDARPLLQLGLRLGEGTGALCAYPIIESAVRMINEMNNFDNAHITKYF